MWLFFTLADWRCTWGLLQCFADLLKERSPKNIDLRDNVQPAGHYCKINTDRVIQQHKAGSDFCDNDQLTVCNPGYRAVQFVVLKLERESAFSSHSFPLEFPIGLFYECW